MLKNKGATAMENLIKRYLFLDFQLPCGDVCFSHHYNYISLFYYFSYSYYSFYFFLQKSMSDFNKNNSRNKNAIVKNTYD